MQERGGDQWDYWMDVYNDPSRQHQAFDYDSCLSQFVFSHLLHCSRLIRSHTSVGLNLVGESSSVLSIFEVEFRILKNFAEDR